MQDMMLLSFCSSLHCEYAPVPSGVRPNVLLSCSSFLLLSSWSFNSNTFRLASSALRRCCGFADSLSRSWLPSATVPALFSSAMTRKDTTTKLQLTLRELGEGL